MNSGFFDLVATIDDSHDLVRLIDRNEARAALVIPARFGRDATTGRPARVQVIINGDNANTATTTIAFLSLA